MKDFLLSIRQIHELRDGERSSVITRWLKPGIIGTSFCRPRVVEKLFFDGIPMRL